MSYAYDIADRLADKHRSLSLYNEHQSHSEFLSRHSEERELFGRSVGRVLLTLQKESRDNLPGPNARPVVNPSAECFLSSRMHSNLERCIGTVAKCFPFCVEALSLALLYIDELQRKYTDVVNCWTLDRMFAVDVVIASKFAYDEVYPNTYYASRLGLTVYELNRLEIAFLSLFGFKMAPDRQRWMKLHCMISRLSFEPTVEECSSSGSCPSIDFLPVPVAACAKKASYGSDLSLSTTDTPVLPSPLTPMISGDASKPSTSSTASTTRQNSVISITISTIMSPESSSISPKPVVDVVNTHGKQHSQNNIGEKSHRHRHHHHRQKKSSSITDTG